jgi:hypothetical protein
LTIEGQTSYTKALFKEPNGKLSPKNSLKGNRSFEDLFPEMSTDTKVMKYNYSSGDENFSDMSEEANDINEVYDEGLRVMSRIPEGPIAKPGFLSRAKTGIVRYVSDSAFGKKINRALEDRDQGNYDSDEQDEVNKSNNWTDKILNIFKNPR